MSSATTWRFQVIKFISIYREFNFSPKNDFFYFLTCGFLEFLIKNFAAKFLKTIFESKIVIEINMFYIFFESELHALSDVQVKKDEKNHYWAKKIFFMFIPHLWPKFLMTPLFRIKVKGSERKKSWKHFDVPKNTQLNVTVL